MTAHGAAEVVLDEPGGEPAFWLVLTHGSNGGVQAPDLLAVRDAALGLGGAVARIVQPFRSAGRRAPGSAARQDEAWLEVLDTLHPRIGGLPLVQGGRSNGARVACRTARPAGAVGVMALAFPLHPPRRPEVSRAEELRAAGTEVLVVNGERDPFGIPAPGDGVHVTVLPGERHDLSRNPAAVGAAVEPWLRRWARVGAPGVNGRGAWSGPGPNRPGTGRLCP